MRKNKRRTKSIKKRKKKNFLSKFYFSLLGLVIFLGTAAAGLVYYSSKFTIKPVQVSGSVDISEDKLNKALLDKINYSYNFLGHQIVIPIFGAYQAKNIESVLAEFPELESLNIQKDYIGKTLIFEAKTKEPIAVWREDYKNPSICYLVDNKASFVKNCEDMAANPALIIIEQNEIIKNNQTLKKNILEGAQKTLKQIAKYNLSGNTFTLLAADKTSFNLENGCKIYFNLQDNLDWQIQKLATILSKKEYANNLANYKYIELRFGNRADLCQKGSKCALDNQ